MFNKPELEEEPTPDSAPDTVRDSPNFCKHYWLTDRGICKDCGHLEEDFEMRFPSAPYKV